MAYLEFIIPEPDPTQRELLIPELEALGFEGFEETDDALKAYIPEERLDEDAWAERRLPATVNRLEDQNWNQVWESNFDPVVIGDFCAVRADFHKPIRGIAHELVITPKMSFGTGHHATTRLMIQAMRTLPIEGRKVVDFGTGTGVLAILAEHLGAEAIWALDNDPWSIENAQENAKRNGAAKTTWHLAENLEGVPVADVVLANINRHILLQFMGPLHALLAPGGLLLLSGILSADRPVIAEAATATGLSITEDAQEGDWVAQLWKKPR